MSDLTTLANVKAWLNVTASTDDGLLTRLITAASNYIQAWLNRTIASQAYTETRSGNGNDVMMFANYPVTAVASVTVGGIAVSPSPDGIQPGYVFDDGEIALIGYQFARGRMNVQLAYTAGYATTPPEIEQACIELIALRYRERDRIGHKSKSLQGETVAFVTADFPDSVKTILQNYKKVISV